eukprot:scaffold9052_cov107-Isochrysis_galbana.AAC.2
MRARTRAARRAAERARSAWRQARQAGRPAVGARGVGRCVVGERWGRQHTRGTQQPESNTLARGAHEPNRASIRRPRSPRASCAAASEK